MNVLGRDATKRPSLPCYMSVVRERMQISAVRVGASASYPDLRVQTQLLVAKHANMRSKVYPAAGPLQVLHQCCLERILSTWIVKAWLCALLSGRNAHIIWLQDLECIVNALDAALTLPSRCTIH